MGLTNSDSFPRVQTVAATIPRGPASTWMASGESPHKCRFPSLIQKLRGRIPHLTVQPRQADTLEPAFGLTFVSTAVTCPCGISKYMGSRWESLALSSLEKLYSGRPCSGHYGSIPTPSAPPVPRPALLAKSPAGLSAAPHPSVPYGLFLHDFQGMGPVPRSSHCQIASVHVTQPHGRP